MALKTHSFMAGALLLCAIAIGCQKGALSEKANGKKHIAASDTILSGMIESLLPSEFFEVFAILPPGQCPGHYDIKLSDIAKVKRAALVVSFRGMPFMDQAEAVPNKQLFIDAKDRNWMAPHSYAAGLSILAGLLIDRFPEHKQQIAVRRERSIQEVTEKEKALSDEIKRAGIAQRPIIASSMLREPLEWMGFCIVGQYGRPESISAKEIASLIHIGNEKGAVLIVDNLQSGPEAGKGIAEALAIPHVILSNFPSEKGYAATLSENVAAMLAAVRTK